MWLPIAVRSHRTLPETRERKEVLVPGDLSDLLQPEQGVEVRLADMPIWHWTASTCRAGDSLPIIAGLLLHICLTELMHLRCQLSYRIILHPAELICLPQGKSMWYIFSYIKKKSRKVSGLALNFNKCRWVQSVSFPCKNEGLVPGRFLFIAWCMADHRVARSFPAVSPRVIASSHFNQPPKYCGMELCQQWRS